MQKDFFLSIATLGFLESLKIRSDTLPAIEIKRGHTILIAPSKCRPFN
jgi:hypothetical protein